MRGLGFQSLLDALARAERDAAMANETRPTIEECIKQTELFIDMQSAVLDSKDVPWNTAPAGHKSMSKKREVNREILAVLCAVKASRDYHNRCAGSVSNCDGCNRRG